MQFNKALTHTILEKTDLRIGVLICGHGSRNRLALEEFSHLVGLIKSRLPGIPVEYGYLEFARPVLREALDRLRSNGVNRVIALPAMLFAAGHAKNDIPSLLNAYSQETDLKIEYGRELGIDPLMISAAGERIKEAIELIPNFIPAETLLAVVGRGSSDPDANSNVSKITRMLVEGFGFGWGESLFSGVTFPLVEPGLRQLVGLGFKHIVVAPYFLFTGVLVSRVNRHMYIVANDFPGIHFSNAKHLGSHTLVVETFIERFYEVLDGANLMNCSLCKYRSNVLGFESEVGLVQESHHHHVEGLKDACDLCEMECTGDCQPQESFNHTHSEEEGHGHHYPYPHADHPLGPVSLKKANNLKSKEK